ncbi:MAG: NADH-quinone oxidoreductase subunit N [Desulfobacteraceae bacterium]|nr:NADH-quinone oxidoreductase subunit N [Desulfobacteraceae bacterium]
MELSIPTINFSALYPEIVICAFALLILMWQVFAKQSQNVLGYIGFIGVVTALIMVVYMPSSFGSRSVVDTFNGLWVVDNYSRFFKLIFLIGTGLTILISIKYIKQEVMPAGEYYAMLLMATLGMMIMASSADLMPIFLGIELMSISLYVLTGYARTRMISNEAALKYFLLGSFATGFLLYGIALLYGASGTTNIAGIFSYIRTSNINNHIIMIGMALLLIGFGFKLAAVPFHMWTPDVYEGAPAPITAFMSAGPKAAAFAAFVRVFLEALPAMHNHWVPVIWWIAVLTMSVGNVIALVQDNIKRMLAYSSIAHAGYVLVGFVAGGKLGTPGILFYMLAYTLMNIGAFAIITYLGDVGEKRITVKDYAGLGFQYPIASVALSLFLFSLAGIPPTAGFMGKFYIFSAAIEAGYLGLAIIGVLNSVVSVYFYLKITVAMYMKTPETQVEGAKPALAFAPMLALAVLISAYGVVRLGIFPTVYLNLVQNSNLIWP